VAAAREAVPVTAPDPYDAALSAIRANVEDLAVWLAVWSARDDARLEPHARRCASDAVNAIDTLLQELHGIRGQLIPEMRASDDAALAHADALLQLLREEDG
jgi:hypothetical protein